MRRKLARPAASAPASDRLSRLHQIDRWIAGADYSRAREQISQFLHLNTFDLEARERLSALAFASRNLLLVEETSQWLVTHYPEKPLYHLRLITSAEMHRLSALTVERSRQFLQKWPDHKETHNVAQGLEKAEREVNDALSMLGIVDANRFEMALDNDCVTLWMSAQRFDCAVDAANSALQKYPANHSLRNNLGLSHLFLGNIEQAEYEFQESLRTRPENIHALAGLARCAILAGNSSQSRAYASRASESTVTAYNKNLKLIETLAMVGDYEGAAAVVEIRAGAAESEEPEFQFIAAVAYSRCGNLSRAQELWKHVLRTDKSHAGAIRNLENSRKPVDERCDAWAFESNQILPKSVIRGLRDRAQAASTPEAVSTVCAEVAAEHPVLLHMIPWFLEHGSPIDRELNLRVAMSLRAAQMKDTLYVFASGRHGTKDQRMSAYNFLVKHKLVSKHGQKFWTNGTETQINLLSFDITFDPEPSDLAPAVQQLVEAAYQAHEVGDSERALKLLEQAVALNPNSPTIHNNLAAAYRDCGEEARYLRAIEQLYKHHPGYFFGCTQMAAILTGRGEYDKAQELLNFCADTDKLHISELRALVTASAKLALARHQPEAAKHWIDMWYGLEPESVQCNGWRKAVERRLRAEGK